MAAAQGEQQADPMRAQRRADTAAAMLTQLSPGEVWAKHATYGGPSAPKLFPPIEMHADAARLRFVPASGRILTLAPIQPLEAGRAIYPEFVTGPFAWRISPFVKPEKAARLKIPTAETLDALLAKRPPAAFLLGHEKKGEEQFAAYARQHGYRMVPPATENELWSRPPSTP